MLIISLLAAAAATSAPTYLRCAFPDSKVELLFTADEVNQVVTISSLTNDYVQRLPAAFGAEQVTFHNSVLNYAINRVDLTVRRSVDQMKNPEIGTCKVEEPPKRAF